MKWKKKSQWQSKDEKMRHDRTKLYKDTTNLKIEKKIIKKLEKLREQAYRKP